MPKERNLTCNICDKTFKYIYTKFKHIRNIHKIQTEEMLSVRKVHLKCPLCSGTAQDYSRLRDHIRDVHNIHSAKEEFRFKNIQDFLMWKRSYERKENKLYSKKAREQIFAGVKTHYYYCCRSGDYIPSGKNLRKLKRGGSRKMNVACPSTLTAKEYKRRVDVVFWTTHAGHSDDLSDVIVLKEERALINDKLKKGVPLKKTLSILQSLECFDEPKRIELTSMQDIRNISKILWTQDQERKHESDTISVRLWCEDMSNLGANSPIVYFKQKNVKDDQELLNLDDLMIIIMTPFQKELLIKLGCNKICIDIIHKTYIYDSKLITLMVVDEFGSGFPAAFCISSRIDEVAMELFFFKLKCHIGNMQCDMFMSTDDPAFFNAWASVMGFPSFRLLSTWDVDKNWRENIVSKIKGKGVFDVKVLLYKRLRVILCQTNKNDIHKLLTNLMLSLSTSKNTTQFAEFFTATYLSRIESWAYCYRESFGLNANMCLEAFHKVLKHFYSDGRVNSRLDKFITSLLLITKEKIYERMIRFCKNKPLQKFKDIIESHTRSTSIDQSSVCALNINMWQLPSSEGRTVIVTYVTESKCKNQCVISCGDCKICVHMYTCTCLENTVKFNICEHIHACHIHFGRQLYTFNECEEVIPTEEQPSKTQTSETTITVPKDFKALIKQKCEAIVSESAKSILSNEIGESLLKKLDSVVTDLSKTKKCKTPPTQPAGKKILTQYLLLKIEKPKSGSPNAASVEQVQNTKPVVCKPNIITHDHCYLKH